MAPKKLKDATLEDLERIFKKYGHKPAIVYGLAVAARAVYFPVEEPVDPHPDQLSFLIRKAEFYTGKIGFLVSLLGSYPESDLAEEIYAEAITQLIELHDDSLFRAELPVWGGSVYPKPLLRLVDFLGQHLPLEGIRGKVRGFLHDVFSRRSAAQTSAWWVRNQPALATLPWGSLTRALFCYQMYAELGLLVKNRIYDAIPALFEAVVEQAGEEKYSCVEMVVWSGWRPSASDSITELFRAVGSDSRALRLLIDLSQAYIDQHGTHYPTEELQLSAI